MAVWLGCCEGQRLGGCHLRARLFAFSSLSARAPKPESVFSPLWQVKVHWRGHPPSPSPSPPEPALRVESLCGRVRVSDSDSRTAARHLATLDRIEAGLSSFRILPPMYPAVYTLFCWLNELEFLFGHPGPTSHISPANVIYFVSQARTWQGLV